MWSLSGELSDETGRLLDKYLKTACPPPRQEETDAEGVLPAAPNRHAEALHQLIAGYGTSPEAATRHGHTATLDLVVDIETLQGKDTGRTPLLEGQPVSVARARLLACEAGVIPSVFNYATGEALELGRALRLPNTALRRKLELEQPEGCAWSGCSLPIAWTEAHHITHWADGGVTDAANLILLCRFHHGRIHTAGWTVEKTGPGQAVITHHEDHENNGRSGEGAGCGCSDWRTDADMDAEHQADDFDYFPTGLYRSEWSENMKFELDARAEAAEQARSLAAMRAARAKCRERFATPAKLEANPGEPSEKAPEPEQPKQPEPVRPTDLGDPPFLRCPLRQRPGRGGKAHHQPAYGPRLPARTPPRVRAHPHARQPEPTRTGQPPIPPPRQCDLFVAASLNRNHLRTGQPHNPPRLAATSLSLPPEPRAFWNLNAEGPPRESRPRCRCTPEPQPSPHQPVEEPRRPTPALLSLPLEAQPSPHRAVGEPCPAPSLPRCRRRLKLNHRDTGQPCKCSSPLWAVQRRYTGLPLGSRMWKQCDDRPLH